MMYQGVLGTFFFTVTDAEVATFRDLKQQREIQFAEHKCVSGLPKVQHRIFHNGVTMSAEIALNLTEYN